ncbi:hypothetical protein B0A67_20080 [Flavobacterium aquidurense]|uniref:DUF6660 family protein n=1 Tax=Flavobacterium aquidurense TaxID=362413 RepID=UPI000932DCB4|nr:DUF6660 family protein [Flavobacterium aquidurense]OXA69058.1 hypothetical protein B0A67_20080 [Flavobacterium aquidurense]
MKILSFILTFYLLSLSGITCADTEAYSAVIKSTEISQSNHNDSNSHKGERDLCSPFCSCACCGIQVVNNLNTISFDFPANIQEISPKVSQYQSILISSFTGSIWQPPQINS